MKMKRAALIFALSAMLAVLAIVLMSFNKPAIDGDSVVAAIDGEPVTFNEFKQSLAGNRAKVASYFQSTYQADIGKSFWTTEFNGEVPLDKLKKEALASSEAIKIPQILAKEKGVVADIGYETFLKNFKAENKRRADAKRNGQVIYGPEQYGESEYYALVNSNMMGDTEKLYRQDADFPDEQLEQVYDANKELYKQRDAMQIKKISVTGADAGKIAKEIKTGIDGGMDAEQASSKYKEQVKIETQLMDSSTAHSDALAYPTLLAKALPLKPGQMTDIFRENGAYLIAQCVERKAAGYRPFAEVKEGIRDDLAGQVYERAVEERSRDAKVVVNREVYDRIGVKDIDGI